MNLQDMINNVNLPKLMAADEKLWRATLRVGDTVLAGKSKPTVLSISNRGVFLVCAITGRFSTLDTGPADTGVCRLSFAMQNGSGRMYIQDPIYMDSFLTPGRVKDAADSSGDPSNQLQFPGIEFLTIFQPKDDITFTVTNEAAVSNTWQMSLHGFWVKG